MKISSPVVPCILQMDAIPSIISTLQLTPRMNTRSCDILERSVDSSIAREYHKNFLAFSSICNCIFSQSSSILCTIELAERLIQPNLLAFSGRKSFAASIMHSFIKFLSVNGFPRSANLFTIL
uniref:Uncharacterized protein n=1 Tax=Octopus bimaculoides TaxID=37653 RepID=A0A0L8HF91_OCTBM